MPSRLSTIVGAIPLVIVALGRFLPGPDAWGFNHLAYLPLWVYGAWLLATGLLLSPPLQRPMIRWVESKAPSLLMNKYALIPAFLMATLFWLFRERTFLYGDGYLITEMIERGDRFRVFDNMDYFLHALLYRFIQALGFRVSAGSIYQFGSIFGGFFGTLLMARLVVQLPWEPSRRWLVMGFFLLGPAAQLFFGHAESYTWLYVASSAFLIAGVLVLEGSLSLWIASSLWGLGLFFHLTAVFGAFAMLLLALKAPSCRHRWAQAFVPPLVILLVAASFHAVSGYTLTETHKEFLGSGITRGMWASARSAHGLLSIYHWKDQINLLILLSAVPTALIFWSAPSLHRRLRDSSVQFVVVHVLSVIVFSVLTDRRLGGARDWDLFAGHCYGAGVLAALLAPPRSARIVSLALCSSVLVATPWILLQSTEASSVRRFVDVAGDYPSYTRAYAYDEVGKYYRNTGDYDRAAEMFEKSVDAFPESSRFQLQLGSVYVSLSRDGGPEMSALAERHLREAVRIDPENTAAADLLASLLLTHGRVPEARELFRALTNAHPSNAQYWEGLGYSELQLGDFGAAEHAFRQVLTRRPDAPVRKGLGSALMSLRRYEDAADVFDAAIRLGDSDPDLPRALAASRVYEIDRLIHSGISVDRDQMTRAVGSVRVLLERDPSDTTAQALAEQLRSLVWTR